MAIRCRRPGPWEYRGSAGGAERARVGPVVVAVAGPGIFMAYVFLLDTSILSTKFPIPSLQAP